MYGIAARSRLLPCMTLLTGALAAVAALVPAAAPAAPVGCGAVLVEDTTLENDLVDCPGSGLVIGADGITVDLAGHTVDGDGSGFGDGIVNFRGHVEVTIENGVVREFGTGIFVSQADHNRLLRLDVSRNSSGIFVEETTNSLIADNTVSNNLGAGVTLDLGSNRNVLTRNRALGNGLWGISVAGSTENVVEQNLASRNHTHGIHVGGGVGTRVDRNLTTQNGQDGIFVEKASLSVVTGNSSHRNGDDGIATDDIFVGQGTTLARNTANHNADLGIEASTATIDGGGNRARGNGNPLQCVNVSCS